MLYEDWGPFCVYVGYACQGGLDILTTIKSHRQSHNPSSLLRQKSKKQDRKRTGERREYQEMNKQVVSCDRSKQRPRELILQNHSIV